MKHLLASALLMISLATPADAKWTVVSGREAIHTKVAELQTRVKRFSPKTQAHLTHIVAISQPGIETSVWRRDSDGTGRGLVIEEQGQGVKMTGALQKTRGGKRTIVTKSLLIQGSRAVAGTRMATYSGNQQVITKTTRSEWQIFGGRVNLVRESGTVIDGFQTKKSWHRTHVGM